VLFLFLFAWGAKANPHPARGHLPFIPGARTEAEGPNPPAGFRGAVPEAVARLLRPVRTPARQRSNRPVPGKAPAPRAPALPAPKCPVPPREPVPLRRVEDPAPVPRVRGGGCPSPLWVQPQPVRGVPPSTAPQRPGSRAAGDGAGANQPPPSPEERPKAGSASSGSRVPAASGLLLRLQQHPVTLSLTSSVASLPKVTFLHSAALPVPRHRATPAAARRPCPPASRGRGGTEPQQQQPRDRCRRVSMASNPVAVLISRTEQAARGSTRDQSPRQGQGRRGAPAPLPPSCAPALGAGRPSLTRSSRRWRKMARD